jgi:hypothetical protein
MLKIREDTIHQFQTTQALRLADRIFATSPALGSVEVARLYVDEALAAGIQTDRDIAEFTLLLHAADSAGRPAYIHELVQDERTDGALKLFQIYYAMHGERP